MNIWLDAQRSPGLAPWLSTTFRVEATPIRDLGLRDAEDSVIFDAAKHAGAVVMTKDRDFVDMNQRLTIGNSSNARMREILTSTLADAIELQQTGESLVEIGEAV